MTWWNHRGTAEWIQMEWPSPRTVAAMDIYWFDDTGRGQCRVPASWQLFRRADGRWIPIEGRSAPGVAPDTFNRLEFEPIATDALRVEVQLQPGVSGGVLEWRVFSPPGP